MTIRVSLSTESINQAIEQLVAFQEDLESGLEKVVEILTTEGAEIAQSAYGDMATAYPVVEGTTGTIMTQGQNAVIAEFGAGQATMQVLFENAPETPVYEGSYSELEGSQEYFKYGSWHFGGRYYTEIPARHGLLDAKQYIIDNSTDVAMGVFGGL